MECPEGETRYQATHYIGVNGSTMSAWEVRCLPGTTEVANLIAAGMLRPEVDGAFPDPVVVPRGCCGG